ncbi:MAG: gamma-glutamylcyclotransferase, partial [Lentisphaeria bacterium]|nr:gamma-glutamylcyclotransferase [Lentisphaeria bacterium]
MNTMFLYFAYGSNMNPARMAKRCPGAIDLGGAVLRNHRVAERLYADIDFVEGAETEGVLYVITEEHLRKLDRYEGYPSVYRRI